MYFFVVDALLLTLGDSVENGNKSIIIGSEDDSSDGRSIVLRMLFEFTGLIAFGDRVGPALASASAKIYKK